MNCLDSYDYLQSLRQLQHGKQLTDTDRLLLYTFWEQLPFVSISTGKSTKKSNPLDVIQCFYDDMLTRLEQALNEPPPVVPASFAYIFERYHQLLLLHNLPSFDKHGQFIIDYLTSILNKPTSNNADDEALIVIALETFNNLTKNTDIRIIMKQRQLTSLFNKYTTTDMGEKRKLAFAILAEIMDEQEINNNPNDVIAVFIEQLKQLNPNESNPDFDSTLSSIQGMIFMKKSNIRLIFDHFFVLKKRLSIVKTIFIL
jgi:hypothetical protein